MNLEAELYELAGERLRVAEPMDRHTTFRIGGQADYFVAPQDALELQKAVELCRKNETPCLVIGNGSNLLCSDEGFHGVVLDTTRGLNRCEAAGNELRAGAGVLLSSLAKQSVQAGLAGLEFAAGIPGSVGGALVMNAGAYGGEMSQVVKWARVLTPDGRVLMVPAPELEFSYRHSAVRSNGWIVLEACFFLEPGDPQQIRRVIEDLAARRRSKQPLEFPSAGSTFKRPAGHYAAQLIDEAGLKGFCVGGAQVSEKHAGFVINRDNATARDVLGLCSQIRERVRANAGVELELEVQLVGEFT